MNKLTIKRLDLWFLIAIFVILFVFVFLRGQDLNWDLLNYHYFSGYSYLNGRTTLDIAPTGLQSYLHPGLNIISYLALKYFSFPFSSWVILSIQLTILPAILLISREISNSLALPENDITRYIALLLCLLSPLWLSELGTSFFESITTSLILWGLFFTFRGFTIEKSSYLFFAGVLFGLACGLKLINALFLIAGLFSVLYLSAAMKRPKTFILFCLGLAVGLIVTVSWYWSLWEQWGSPVFPLYNAIFKSEYYNLTNFRDTRWMFTSFTDFAMFLMNSAFRTNKTSEVFFSDVRVIILVLLFFCFVLFNSFKKLNHISKAFLIFILTGTFLWAFTLAYQRYLLPVEILLGLVIWILIVNMTKSTSKQILVMTIILITCFFGMRIPDWGHSHVQSSKNNPFEIQLPDSFENIPAQYLVIGVPVSYILPSFNQKSRFYGLNLSSQMNKLIVEQLSKTKSLPIRVLAKSETSREVIAYKLLSVGMEASSYNLICYDLTSKVSKYILCDLTKL